MIKTSKKRGHLIQIFLGNMRGGKTDSLIREVESFEEHSDKSIVCFKPDKDTRSAPGLIQSRKKNGDVLRSQKAIEFPSERPEEIIKIIAKMIASGERVDVIAIDEVQFCDPKLYATCDSLLDKGHDLLVAGLALDFRREPFGPTLSLIGLSDDATKINWKNPHCDKCRNDKARFPQRLIDEKPAPYTAPQISVEGQHKNERYEVRCHNCHELPLKPF